MRSTFAGLNTMVRGINGNQLSLDTVGHNITNANTTGYSRQSVNLVATRAQEIYSIYGTQLVGTGTDSQSITRARNIYADKQYWTENGTNSYYTTKQTNYDKVEAIFNDSDNNGIENAMSDFYSSWSDLSSNASTTSNRTTVIEKGKVLADRITTAASQLQDQIKSNYDELSTSVSKVNDLTDQIVSLNKNIASIEATGANANDLRDQRDNLVDTLSGYTNINVYEEANTGMYTIVSNGASLVAGVSKLNLQLSDGKENSQYGVTDYTVQIKETGTTFTPANGTISAELNNVSEDQSYMDKLSNMSAFLLTTFNDQHKAGYGMSGSSIDVLKTNINFYGDNDTTYTWDSTNSQVVAKLTSGTASNLKGIQVINALEVSSKLTGADGTDYVAATGSTTTTSTSATMDGDSSTTTTDATTGVVTTVTVSSGTKTTTVRTPNGTGDGSNATLMSTLFNSTQSNTVDKTSKRAIGEVSLNSYYNTSMSALGVDSQAMDDKTTYQSQIMTQVENWRSSTSGVNWNEELTNMIKFQQGYSSCSRCLTTMDEMLDKLINSTGTVGR